MITREPRGTSRATAAISVSHNGGCGSIGQRIGNGVFDDVPIAGNQRLHFGRGRKVEPPHAATRNQPGE